jgi:hypothetical protein
VAYQTPPEKAKEMSITNTSKENLKDEHNKHHQRKLKR